jgi:hypothetical protein
MISTAWKGSNMTDERLILQARCTDVPSGTFVVARILIPSSSGRFNDTNTQPVYKSDGSLGGNLYGLGIALQLSATEGQSLMVFHPDDEVISPRNSSQLNTDSSR